MTDVVGDRYEIRDELGRGGTATVYRAYDRTLQRFVALKLLSGSIANDKDFLLRFEREALVAARLDHPNIVTIFDYGQLSDGRAFIAMRLLEGQGLEVIMRGDKPVPPDFVVSMVRQIARALDYTHKRDTVHRDVKPSNVIVDETGHTTLTDFGIARAFDSARVTLTGLTVGTPRYMAPEQIRGEEFTSVTDVYALGVLTFEMLAGRPPFEGAGTALMYKIVHEEPPAITAVNSEFSPEVAAVISRAIEKDPSDRWPSAGEFAAALAAALQPAAPAAAPDGADAVVPTNVGEGPEASLPTIAGTHNVDVPPATPPAAPVPTAAQAIDQQPPTEQPTAGQPTAAGTAATQATTAQAAPAPPAAASPAAGATAAGSTPGRGAPPPQAGPSSSGPTGGGPGNRKPLVIGGAAFFGVVAVAAIVFFVFSGGGSGSADDDATPTATVSDTDPATETPTVRPTNTPTTAPLATATRTPTRAPTATSTPAPTATPTTRWAEITGIGIVGGSYSIPFRVGNYALTGSIRDPHVHFYFDNIPESQAGVPGNGPWIAYGGGSPFTQYSPADAGSAARVCIVVANSDHSIILGTGNCILLP